MHDSYQRGSIAVDKYGIWSYRWRENGERKSVSLGQCSKSEAKRKADRIRAYHDSKPVSEVVKEIIKEMRGENPDKQRRGSTMDAYEVYFAKHIVAKWGAMTISEFVALPPVKISSWLHGLGLAPMTCSQIRWLLKFTIEKAMYFGYIPVQENPIKMVHASKRREHKARPLTQAEFLGVIDNLREPYKSMSIVCAFLGLRFSELRGLQWSDVDTKNRMIHIRRSLVRDYEEQTKNEASEASLPLAPELVALFESWPVKSKWIWASPYTAYEKPYSYTIAERHLKAAGKKIGIEVTSHSFRHSQRTWLAGLGESLEVQKRLMRHSNISMTLKYGQTPLEVLRPAHEKIARMKVGA